MKSRKLWLAIAVLAVAGLVATPLLGADVFRSELTALDEVALIGSTTPLEVSVSPILVGGTGDLFIVAKDGQRIALGEFALAAPVFVIDAPVPPVAGAGERVQYYFQSFSPEGKAPDVSTPATVLLHNGQGTDEPPAWK